MAIQFITADRPTAEDDLAAALETDLRSGKTVLLLLSGGSNIESGIRILDKVSADTSRLTVSLVDERYGEIGHANSNMAALEKAGLASFDIRTIPVLTGDEFATTVGRFSEQIDQALLDHDISYALLGIGADGHIAGILPGSLALDSSDTVVGYQGPDHLRISLSLQALTRLTHGYTFAFGEENVAVLKKLQTRATELVDQPSQILHELADARVYNEYVQQGALS